MAGKFKLTKRTRIEDLIANPEMTLPESDLCIQEGGDILQFEYDRGEEQKKIQIKPGVYNLTKTAFGIDTVKANFTTKELLTSVQNTSRILKEAHTFFQRLHVYEELNQLKKRGIMLYSAPGCGKTSAISRVVEELIAQDSNTVVINWPTSELHASDVERFLGNYAEFAPECSRLIFIIEDIGGGENESRGRRNEVDSSLLNLLDGVNNVFKIPTLIVATTNYPENLLSALADRPGRFDLMMKLQPPSFEERVALVEFVSKKPLTEDEKKALDEKQTKGVERFSIAHLKEIVIRSRLHDKSLAEVINELVTHSNEYERDFREKKGKGLGFSERFE